MGEGRKLNVRVDEYMNEFRKGDDKLRKREKEIND